MGQDSKCPNWPGVNERGVSCTTVSFETSKQTRNVVERQLLFVLALFQKVLLCLTMSMTSRCKASSSHNKVSWRCSSSFFSEQVESTLTFDTFQSCFYFPVSGVLKKSGLGKLINVASTFLCSSNKFLVQEAWAACLRDCFSCSFCDKIRFQSNSHCFVPVCWSCEYQFLFLHGLGMKTDVNKKQTTQSPVWNLACWVGACMGYKCATPCTMVRMKSKFCDHALKIRCQWSHCDARSVSKTRKHMSLEIVLVWLVSLCCCLFHSTDCHLLDVSFSGWFELNWSSVSFLPIVSRRCSCQ